MIFPFKIKFERVLKLKSPIESENIFELIKENIITESFGAARNFEVQHNVLYFTTSYLGGSTLWTMKTIDKASFRLDINSDLVTCIYTYFIGRIYLYLGFILFLYSLVPKSSKRQVILLSLGIWVATFILSWISTYWGQTSMFKRIVNKIEIQYG